MSILPQLMPAEEQKSASHHKCPLFWKSSEVTARSGDAHNWTENVLKDRNRFRAPLDVASVCVKHKTFLVVVWPFFYRTVVSYPSISHHCCSCSQLEPVPAVLGGRRGPRITAYGHCLNCKPLNAASERNIWNAQPSLCVSREPINTETSWPTSPVVITVLVTLPCARRKTINASGGLLSCLRACDSQEFIRASP